MHPTSVDPLLDHRADELAASRAGLDDAARRHYLERLVEPFGPGQARWLERTEDVELADHRRERWLIEVLPGVRFHTYRLVPHGWTSGGPAVVVVHGHGYGSREVLGLDADGRPVAEPRTTPVALHTAAQGLLTLVPDVVGFGERTTDRDPGYDPDASHSCYRLGTRLLLQGATLTGLRVAELLGLIAAPTDDPAGARPGRLGLLGFSGGGMWAMIAAALDDRIAATALCAYPNLFATSIEPIRHCLCNHLPGLLAVGEQPDFAALIHPRALFCETGRNDPIFPVAGFEAAVDALERRWADHPDAFGHDVHEGGHQISGARSVPWLFRRLSVSD